MTKAIIAQCIRGFIRGFLFLKPKKSPKSADKIVLMGKAFVWGVKPFHPIINIPPDAISVKVKLRAVHIGRAFVKYPDRVEDWALQPADGITINHPNWKLGVLLAVNCRKNH